MAARENRGGNIEKLVARGAEIPAHDRTNETALHWAAKDGNRNALKSLLDLVSDWGDQERARLLERKGLRDRTALEMARRNALDAPDESARRAFRGVIARLEREHGRLAG